MDNDATPSLSINDVGMNEAAATATFTVTLSAVSALNVSFNYSSVNIGGEAVAGLDYSSTSGSNKILAGSTTTTIIVPLL